MVIEPHDVPIPIRLPFLAPHQLIIEPDDWPSSRYVICFVSYRELEDHLVMCNQKGWVYRYVDLTDWRGREKDRPTDHYMPDPHWPDMGGTPKGILLS